MSAVLLLSLIGSGAFKCAVPMDPMVATSADGKTTVVVLMEGKVLVYGKGQKAPRKVAKWDRFGHHLTLVVNRDASSIALIDRFAGLEVLDANGNRRAFLQPEKILTQDELENTPGRWMCHPEGTWLVDPKLEFSASSVSFSLYNGRKLSFDLKQ